MLMQYKIQSPIIIIDHTMEEEVEDEVEKEDHMISIGFNHNKIGHCAAKYLAKPI